MTARDEEPLTIEVTRADLQELATILFAERVRLDAGEGRPVPQPRWGANVRIAQAVQRALDAAPTTTQEQ